MEPKAKAQQQQQRWRWVRPILPDLVAAARMGSGKEVLQHFMKQIYQRDGAINAVVESCAPVLDTTHSIGRADLRPLEGLPFLVKDSMDVRGFHTACGSAVYASCPAAEDDCSIVSMLRQLGAIPVGKTNLPPLGLDVQTFNDVYGTTCNPYDARLTAGGSSGGSAAAVALGLAAFSVGTDWNGSLRIPAAFCGVCSLRASRGRLTINGKDRVLPAIPEDPGVTGHIMVAGIFTKTVADLKFCASLLLASPHDGGSHSSSKNSLKQMEGSSTEGTGAQGTTDSSNRRDENFTSVGVAVSFSGILLDQRISEALRQIPLWLAESQSDVGAPKMKAMIVKDFALDLKEIHESMKVFSMVLESRDVLDSRKHSEKLEWAKRVQAKATSAVDNLLESSGLSALILPACSVLPPEHNYDHDPVLVNGVEVPYWRVMCSFVEPFSVSGNPVVTIPLCWIEGKPCGIQVIGKLGHDENLLSTCVKLEQALHVAKSATE